MKIIKCAVFLTALTVGGLGADEEAPPFYTWAGIKHHFAGFEREAHWYGPLGFRQNHFLYQISHYPVFERPDVVPAGAIKSDLTTNTSRIMYSERQSGLDVIEINTSNTNTMPMIRYGLAPNIEVTLGLSQLSRDGSWDMRINQGQVFALRPKPGFGNVTIGGKAVLTGSADRGTLLSLRGQVVPSIAKTTDLLTPGSTEGSIDLLFQHRLLDWMTLYGNLGRAMVRDIETSLNQKIKASSYNFASLGIEIPFRVGSLFLQGHVNNSPYDTPFDRTDKTAYTGLAGWGFRMSQGQALKVGMSLGTNSGAASSQMVIQLTQEF